MEGVGIITILIVGALAGVIAEKLTKSDHSLVMNAAVGIAGAFVGALLAGFFGIDIRGFFSAFIAAIVGATLLIVIFRAIMARRSAT